RQGQGLSAACAEAGVAGRFDQDRDLHGSRSGNSSGEALRSAALYQTRRERMSRQGLPVPRPHGVPHDAAMSRFLQALHSGRVLLMDGAMGTELQRAGIGAGECYELWNLTHPDRVRAVHQAYVDAGAEALLTNTFQANGPALEKHGLRGQLGE